MTYSKAQIAYHWLTAILVVVMAATGLAYSYDLLGNGVMTVHQISGQILIVVMIARIAARLTGQPAPRNPHHARWERALAGTVQIALYGLLIAYVVTGYISASAETDSALLAPVSLAFARSDLGEQILEVHYALKWALLGLIGLHLAGALKHALIDRDGTVAAMMPTRPPVR